ncbi:MAG: hypothetical protein JO016_00730 [Actinobacteria bacterium]|nr:hypothetical protein [Actinomycetota bacterium]
MSVKAKIAAGAATFAMVGGGLGMAGTLTASAATPSCGDSCVSLYTQKFGTHDYVDVYQQRAAAGQESILFQGSNSDPALDFTVYAAGTVDSFYTNHGLVSSAFDHTYGSLEAYEYEYSPYGRNSGFCLSTWPGVAPQPGYKVRLEPCGRYSNTLWAVDTADETANHRYAPLINGATNNFSNPEVLNYPAGNPNDMPRPVLNVQPLNTYSNGTVFDNQEWAEHTGVLH